MNTTWDLSDFYKSERDPQIEKDIEKSISNAKTFISKWKPKKEYLNDPQKLFEALEEFEVISEGAGVLTKQIFYFFLRLSLEQDNKELKAKENLITDKETEISNELNFFSLSIAKIPKSKQNEFLTYPKLQKYKHNLERVFETAKHNLSEKEEKIVSILTKSGTSNWTEMIQEFLSKESKTVGGKDMTFEELMSSTRRNDKKLRDQAGNALDEILDKWAPVAEHELNSFLEVDKNINKLRKFKDVDSERHFSDDMDSEIVNSLRKTVTDSFSISQRYYSLFAKLLKQKKVGYHERAMDINTSSEVYEYSKAIEIVQKVFNSLDSELGKMVNEMVEKNRIDVYPKKGKSGGAFNIGINPKYPVFVLLNFDKSITDITTIAHELGHAVNDLMMYKYQTKNNADTLTSTAEVASTFFEDFALEEIVKNANEEQKFQMLFKKVQDDISAIFRQIACYNFEYDLHVKIKEKGYLSKDEIGNLFKQHMLAYMGDSVDFTDLHKNWWVYWSHIRRPFYVYSYANGLLISKSLQKLVKENPKNIDKVKTFLSAGISKSPKDIFKDAGVDITSKKFWQDGIDEIDSKLTELEVLAKKLGKI